MRLPSVSVVIPTFGRRDGLRRVVAAAADDPHVCEVVVVVDGSADGSFELLTDMAAGDGRIRPVWQDNAGDLAARQTGVEHARGEVVLILDDDVVAGPGLAAGHAVGHVGTGGLVLLGYMPVALPAERRPGDFATHLYAREYEQICARYERDPSSVLRHLWMGNVSLRRQDALRVGLSGPRRLGYHGDQDFGLRCLRAGLIGRFDRSLTATHVHHRALHAFARQAWLSGMDRRYLLEAYPDLLSERDLRGELSPPVQAAIGVAATRVLHPATEAALSAAVRASGRLGLWAAEAKFGRLLRQVRIEHGYRHPTEGTPVTPR